MIWICFWKTGKSKNESKLMLSEVLALASFSGSIWRSFCSFFNLISIDLSLVSNKQRIFENVGQIEQSKTNQN